jgi:hypothetical protein
VVRIIEDTVVTSNFWEGDAVAISGGRRSEARTLRAGFSERSRLRKTATKPAA